MKIHEYQAKQLLSTYGIAALPGGVAYTAEEAQQVASDLGGSAWAVKAQILAGGRGESGGVRLVNSLPDVRETAGRMLGEMMTTTQTGAAGEAVRRIYVEQACDVSTELYLGMIVDRATARVTLMASARGGAAIEALAAADPEGIVRVAIDTETGLMQADALALANGLGLSATLAEQVAQVMRGMYEAFIELDASLIEINPLVVTRAGELIALDAKMSFDDNALFRHKNIADLRDEEDPGRLERIRHGFNYLKLDGNIGCMVNGAALAMATMDIIKLHGGRPANFLDIPPVANREQIAAAFKLVLSDADVQVVLVNIVGGGITRCDAVAEGMAAAARAVSRRLPLVVRFEGTNRDLAKKTLRDTGVVFNAADTLADAAERAVKAVAWSG